MLLSYVRVALLSLTCGSALSGCSLWRGYRDAKELGYYKSLSSQEKAAVEQKGFIVKEWYGTNKDKDYTKGKLHISKPNEKLYNFTEVGLWTEKMSARRSGGWRATVKDSVIYDDYGNILYREKYMDDETDAAGPYLFEKWTSINTDSLRQIVTAYFSGGKPRIVQYITVLNPTEKVTDYAHDKKLTKALAYDINGKSISLEEARKSSIEWFWTKKILMKK